ncbi:MAG: hypothetical protein QOK29_4228 [Rhodospirillaceae bacterium]|jgi:hypothetical protein|nr:hypothetical protein [Rhodospirillaceae bacterium]
MKIQTNADGSVTVTCDGQSVTVSPSPAQPSPEVSAPLATPNTVSALLIRRNPLAAALGRTRIAPLRMVAQAINRFGEPIAATEEYTLVLHVQGGVNLDSVRNAMRRAGLPERTSIEIVPVTERARHTD